MAAILQLHDVCKIYNRHQPDEMVALSDIDLDVTAGEVVALTGPSGSGKTTLLSLLGCMGRPTSGTISLNERQISRLPERFLAKVRRETFGFVFQHYNLLRDVTVLENVMLPLYPTTMRINVMKHAAQAVLERFALNGMADKKVKLLSGGEQQRVAIARALITNPDIIIADEPTAHLDRNLAYELVAIFEQLAAEGKSLIIASHDPLLVQSDLIQRRIELRFGCIEGDVPL